jgi:aspartate racemase
LTEKIVGILGGMGPEATADLFMRIIRATPAKRDQDHLRVIIYSNSKVPDRTPAILGKGPSPLPEMLRTGRALEAAGADFIIIPCNTAHYYYDDLTRGLKLPILHMIRLAAEETRRKSADITRAGLLATDGTVASRLYHDAFSEAGIEIITPPPRQQADVMRAIYKHVKAGDLDGGGSILRGVEEELVGEGSEAVICGCTEVSLVLRQGDLEVPVIDPLQVLAEAAVDYAFGRRK